MLSSEATAVLLKVQSGSLSLVHTLYKYPLMFIGYCPVLMGWNLFKPYRNQMMALAKLSELPNQLIPNVVQEFS